MDRGFDSHGGVQPRRRIENAASKPTVKMIDASRGDGMIRASDLVDRNKEVQLRVFENTRVMIGKRAKRTTRTPGTSYIEIDSYTKDTDALPDLSERSFSIEGVDSDNMPKVTVHSTEGHRGNAVYEVWYDNERKPVESIKHDAGTTFTPKYDAGLTYRLFVPADLKNGVYLQLARESHGNIGQNWFNDFTVGLKKIPPGMFQ